MIVTEKSRIGHQAPKGSRVNEYHSIELRGDFHYCWSHHFVYNKEEQEKLLYDAKPCIFTDGRFGYGPGNYFGKCVMVRRTQPFSLKAAMRFTESCKGIPKGAVVEFGKRWYFTDKKVNGSFLYKVKKENPIDIEYEVSRKSYFKNFDSCQKSNDLTKALREAGFLVSVVDNTDFLMSMVKTAGKITSTNTDDIDDKIKKSQIAVAYGNGLIIGFSSGDSTFRGYMNGRDNILFERFGEFDKWSYCIPISKSKSVDSIVETLKSL